ncbi:MAG: hypothetical protein ACXAD7_15850 [Candidatus Kariarchaeaceae archaeon]|jgi:hypothetical protein
MFNCHHCGKRIEIPEFHYESTCDICSNCREIYLLKANPIKDVKSTIYQLDDQEIEDIEEMLTNLSINPIDVIGSHNYEEWLKRVNSSFQWYYAKSGLESKGKWFAVGENSSGEWAYQNGIYGDCVKCDWLKSVETKMDALIFLNAMANLQHIGNSKSDVIAYLESKKDNKWKDNILAIDQILHQLT